VAPGGVRQGRGDGPDCRPVRFTLALPMCPPERLLPLARLADETGWDGLCLPESVFTPEEVSGSYPFTGDGERFWPLDAPWLDPWVALPAIGAVTERLVLSTGVVKLTLRHPLLVAKALATLAALYPGRVELGVGMSWMPEEYEWLGIPMAGRGARLDEELDVLRAVLAGGWVEHHGEAFSFGRLRSDPVPPVPVPLHVGGHSDAALRRAARRGDGWIGAQVGVDDLRDLVGRLRRFRDQAGADAVVPPDGDFAVKATPLVAPSVDAMEDVADVGLTEVITTPWYFYPGDPSDPGHQDESVARFAAEVIRPMGG
jgi:probable F420-dependent oxidoreductase